MLFPLRCTYVLLTFQMQILAEYILAYNDYVSLPDYVFYE